MADQLIRFPGPVDETQPPFLDLSFLVIDDNADGRFLIEKTLLRKFPSARIVGCQTLEAAGRALETSQVNLIVAHRTFEHTGLDLLRELRRLAPEKPIVMTSGMDRRKDMLAGGA